MTGFCHVRSRSVAASIILLAAIATSVGQTPPPDVLISGAISSHTMGLNDLLRFTLTFKNKTAANLSAVRFVAPPDHYSFTQVCVLTPQAAETCRSGSDFAAPNNVTATTNLLITSLSPGQNFIAWGYLKPEKAHRTETLTLGRKLEAPRGFPRSANIRGGNPRRQSGAQPVSGSLGR
jgi:hypothetical protein